MKLAKMNEKRQRRTRTSLYIYMLIQRYFNLYNLFQNGANYV